MKNLSILLALAVLLVTGCSNGEQTTTTEPTNESTTSASGDTVTVAYEVGSKKKGDMAICVICNAKEGTTAEEVVAETIEYEGKTYAFCNEQEKAEFISDPAKYAKK